MTNLDNVFKSKDITLLTKIHIVKAIVFPVVMYGCESWTIKMTVPKKWCYQTVVLEKTLESPLESKEIKLLEEINPEYSLEGLMLKLQYFGHLMQTADSLEKTLMLGRLKVGGEGDNRGWDGWMVSPAQWTWLVQTLGDGEGQGSLACCSPWGRIELDMTWRLNSYKKEMGKRCQQMKPPQTLTAQSHSGWTRSWDPAGLPTPIANLCIQRMVFTPDWKSVKPFLGLHISCGWGSQLQSAFSQSFNPHTTAKWGLSFGRNWH